MTKGEWSGWMQAVFSVTAIVGAIGIAWWQITHQRTRELAKLEANARLIGDSLMVQMFFALSWLENMERKLTLALEKDVKFKPSSDSERAKTIELPTDEQLLHLTPVWPATAALIVKFRSGATLLTTLLNLMAHHDLEPGIVERADLAHILDICRSTLELLRQSMKGIPIDKTWTDPIRQPTPGKTRGL